MRSDTPDLRCTTTSRDECAGFTGLLSQEGPINLTKSIRRNRYFIFFIIFGFWFWEVADAMADRIIMKDGTIEESDHIWETEKYIHFILKGTTSVEIRFLKDIVERVESDSITFPAKIPDTTQVQSETDQTSPMGAAGQPTIVEASEQIPPHDQGPDDQLAKANKGVRFYDPHREKRYWAERNAHFDTLDEALAAIAVRYQRPTDWVVDHMGEENDIGIIFSNLNHRLSLELAKNPSHSLGGNQHSGHPEYLESSTYFQKEPSRPQDAAGNTPDPGASTINSESKNSKGAVRGLSNNQAVVLNALNGIQFYNPRRPQKYWVGPNEKYDTLNAALKALAVHYNTTVQWVEDHIGNTNALSEIHENIRNSLQP